MRVRGKTKISPLQPSLFSYYPSVSAEVKRALKKDETERERERERGRERERSLLRSDNRKLLATSLRLCLGGFHRESPRAIFLSLWLALALTSGLGWKEKSFISQMQCGNRDKNPNSRKKSSNDQMQKKYQQNRAKMLCYYSCVNCVLIS